MKLKITSKGEANKEETKKKQQKMGKRSKTKGSNYERDVAKKFKSFYNESFVRTPQSGGFAKKLSKANNFRGDIVLAEEDLDLNIHIECKNTKTWSLPAWIKQAFGDCPKGKVPVIIFHQHNTSKDFISMSLEDFFKLVPKENIIKKVD